LIKDGFHSAICSRRDYSEASVSAAFHRRILTKTLRCAGEYTADRNDQPLPIRNALHDVPARGPSFREDGTHSSLYGARRLFRLHWRTAAWVNLENQILGFEREGTPGRDYPYCYFEYLREGRGDPTASTHLLTMCWISFRWHPDRMIRSISANHPPLPARARTPWLDVLGLALWLQVSGRLGRVASGSAGAANRHG